MTETKSYEGGCHCGKVRYRVTTDLATVIECNCSHCSRKGFLLTFVPNGQFELLEGESALREYRFNKKKIQHLFCSECGVQSFGRGAAPDGTPMVAVNVRCLDGVEPRELDITPVDGRSL